MIKIRIFTDWTRPNESREKKLYGNIFKPMMV